MKPTGDGMAVELVVKKNILANPFDNGEETYEDVSEYLMKKGVAFKRGVRERILKSKERLSRLSAKFEETPPPSDPEVFSTTPGNVKESFNAEIPSCYHTDNTIPKIPNSQVFKARVQYVDKNLVAWVMPEEHLDDLVLVDKVCRSADQN